jgi:hypothetical protein
MYINFGMIVCYYFSGYIIMVRNFCSTLYAMLVKFPWFYLDIDGAYFGTTFPHLFLMTYGQLKPQKPSQGYVPRVFGFKLHKPWSWSLSFHESKRLSESHFPLCCSTPCMQHSADQNLFKTVQYRHPILLVLGVCCKEICRYVKQVLSFTSSFKFHEQVLKYLKLTTLFYVFVTNCIWQFP